jgi:hypothetical protein
MIPGGCTDHSPSLLEIRERRNHIIGSTDFIGADWLEILTFEVDVRSITERESSRVLERCTLDDTRTYESVSSCFYKGKWDHMRKIRIE